MFESLAVSQAEEEDYSEEESSKVDLKQDSNDSCESAARGEKGSEKPDPKGAVTGERQSGDGQVGVPRLRPGGWQQDCCSGESSLLLTGEHGARGEESREEGSQAPGR